MFKIRSYETELIDKGEGYYTPEEYRDALEKLGAVGKILGGDRATRCAFKNQNPSSILEIGCGGGFTAWMLSKWFPHASILGIDMNPRAITFAFQRHRPLSDNLRFEYRANKGVSEGPKSFDIVTTTLVTHHMNDADLIEFLRDSRKVARQAVIINDLHRHWIAYWFYYFVSPLLFRNRLIRLDGLLSIKKSFVRKELEYYLENAGVLPGDYCIRWVFPFRWIIIIRANG